MPAKYSSPLKAGRPVGSTSTDPTIAKAFGNAVVELRTAQGISQEALALKATVDRSYLGRLERGQNVPNLVAVVKMAAALDCSVAELAAKFEQHLKVELGAGTRRKS